MIRNLERNKQIWVLIGALTLITSFAGVYNPNIYDEVLDRSILPATLAQDALAFITALIVIGLSLRVKESQFKLHLVIIGCLGFFFYAYMIYAVERLYTVFYMIYLAIIGLSFYSIIYTIISFDHKVFQLVKLPKKVRRFSSYYNMFSAVTFSAIWVSQIIPLIQTRTKPEFLYSIYIIDICFILPSLFLSGLLASRNKGLGVSMLLPTSIIGLMILAPLWLSEATKPAFYGLPINYPEMSLFLVVSTIFLVSIILNLRSLDLGKTLS
jgi:hypothetical protein